jgi:hypothetical protein
MKVQEVIEELSRVSSMNRVVVTEIGPTSPSEGLLTEIYVPTSGLINLGLAEKDTVYLIPYRERNWSTFTVRDLIGILLEYPPDSSVKAIIINNDGRNWFGEKKDIPLNIVFSSYTFTNRYHKNEHRIEFLRAVQEGTASAIKLNSLLEQLLTIPRDANILISAADLHTLEYDSDRDHVFNVFLTTIYVPETNSTVILCESLNA